MPHSWSGSDNGAALAVWRSVGPGVAHPRQPRLQWVMPTVTPFIWLQHPLKDCVRFYIDVFGGAALDEDYGPQMQSATIEVLGQRLHLFHAEPARDVSEAFSLMVTCTTQEEIDRYWHALAAQGTPLACGWVTDRYGLTWQIIPEHLQEWLRDPVHGPAVSARMLEMVKIDIAPLRAILDSD